MTPRDLSHLVLLAALWGAAFPLMRVTAPVFGAETVAFARLAIGALLLVPLVVLRFGLSAMRGRLRALAFVGIAAAAAPFALFAYAALTVPAGFAAVLNATTPMFTALIAALWTSERPSRWSVAGMVVGLAGVVVLVSERITIDSLGSGPAIAACLVAAMLYGVGANFTRERLAGVPPLVVAAGMQAFAALSLLPFAAAAPHTVAPAPGHWIALAALGLACTGFALILYFGLIGRVGPSKAVTVTFLIPVFGIAFGAVFLGESISLTMLAGAAIVLLGTAMSVGVLAPSGRVAKPG